MTGDAKETQNVAPPKQTQSVTPRSTSKKAQNDFTKSLPSSGKPAPEPSRRPLPNKH